MLSLQQSTGPSFVFINLFSLSTVIIYIIYRKRIESLWSAGFLDSLLVK